MSRRLHIGRLDLDLRGIDAPTAEAAARRLGPALAAALDGRMPRAPAASALDAGRTEVADGSDASALAERIAGRIAARLAARTDRGRQEK